MTELIFAKSKVSKAFTEKLMSTGNSMLLHSVKDPLWGIGVDTTAICHPINLKGLKGDNLHGLILMRLRDKLRADANVGLMGVNTISTQEDGLLGCDSSGDELLDLSKPSQPAVNSDASSTQDAPIDLSVNQTLHCAVSKPSLDNQKLSFSGKMLSKVKSQVLILSDSIAKDVSARNVTDKCLINKVHVSEVEKAQEFVRQTSDSYQCVIIQLVSDEIKKPVNPKVLIKDTADQIIDLVHVCQQKWVDCKVIMSLALPRADNDNYASLQDMVNGSIEYDLRSIENVLVLKHFDMCYQGWPLQKLFQRDGVHLTPQGSKVLTMKYKNSIHKTLDL